MPRASNRAQNQGSTADESGGRASDFYTMAEAAALKGVSYHTVSRAVRRNILPSQRLGRMALIAAEDLRDWQPMRERAPHRYRRREPNPDATPALIDLSMKDRVALALELSTLYEVLHEAAVELPLPEFLSLLTDRLAASLGFRRVAIWGVDPDRHMARRLARFGPLLSAYPDVIPVDQLPMVTYVLGLERAQVLPSYSDIVPETPWNVFEVSSIFVAPLRVGQRALGVLFGDRDGEPFTLSRDQLVLAQGLANQAALALDRARLHAEEVTRADQVTAILENVGDAVFASDAAGRLTVINAAGRKLLALDEASINPNEHMIETVRKVRRETFDGAPIAPEDTPLMRAARGEVVRDQRHFVITPDGTRKAVSVNAQPIVGADGVPRGAVAVARDITSAQVTAQREADRVMQLEAAAARSGAVADVALAVNTGTDLGQTLRTAIERITRSLGGLHGGIFFREGDDGQMVGQMGPSFSDAAETVTIGLESAPAVRAAFARHRPHYYTSADASPAERLLFERFGFKAALVAPLLVGDEAIGALYIGYASNDRPPSDEEMQLAADFADQCAVAIDKSRLMERIESAHRRLLAVVDHLPLGVIIVEAPSGRQVLANQAAEELIGGALPEFVVGALNLAAADGSAFPAGEDPLTLTLRTGSGRFGETLTLHRMDGSAVTVLANHVPVRDAAGRIVGAVSVLQDAALLRTLDQAKDEFLSIAAHELRNPLTSLHGNLQLLMRRVQTDPQRADEVQRVETILAQSDRLAQLVSRLLDVSRAELGRLDLTIGPSDAAAVVRQAVEGARGLSTAHRITAETPDELMVTWDEVRIEQVLANLVGNAIKHTPGGDVRVTVETATVEQVVIRVQDSGPGIPDAVKVHLFERYVRGRRRSAGEVSESRGLGLGLYISRLIARAHGGDLTVADAEDGGAVFVLSLPREAHVQRSQTETTAAAMA